MKKTECSGSFNLTLNEPHTVSGAATEEAAKGKARKWILVYIYVNTGSSCAGTCDSERNACTATLSAKDLETAVGDVFGYFSNNEALFGVTIPTSTFKLKCRCVEKPTDEYMIREPQRKKA